MIKTFILFTLLFLIASCQTYSDHQKKTFEDQINKYLVKNKIVCRKSKSGLFFKVLNEGVGNKIQYTDSVSFCYTGKLLNGTIFDNQKKPITFAVKDLIAGWKEIILNSKPGAKVFLVTPPYLAYGDNDLDDIPPNSILIFNMEIKNVK